MSTPERPSRTTARGSRRSKPSVAVSVFIGVLMVPLAAAASVMMVSPARSKAQSVVEKPAVAASPTTMPVSNLEADLRNACGPAGMELVALESSGSLTELQQAALDALRPICSEQGLALPEPPTPEQVVQTVIVTASAPTTTEPAPTYDDDNYDDDSYEDEDHEDHDDHEDHEDDGEHESDD